MMKYQIRMTVEPMEEDNDGAAESFSVVVKQNIEDEGTAMFTAGCLMGEHMAAELYRERQRGRTE